ncbi:MAG: cofactor-independent phosphoglycerate mutase [Candidatus Aadella gelida]|nr:cofactor-independent phosphoglycerate mutase [Candidatus Aadella gelida]
MKYIILVPDGMAGEPLKELNDRTCMEVAVTPNMDMIALKGIVGTSNNVPRGMTPASDVANLSILGYDPKKYYCGRGPLEAANLGVEIGESDVAFRFNVITEAEDRMLDYSAGHISTEEVKVLVRDLEDKMGSDKYTFYPGTSYRNLLLFHCASPGDAEDLSLVKCYPPHDILDQSISKHLPKSQELVEITNRSKEVLEGHDINKVRIDLGQNPANSIWLWGQGRKPDIPLFKDAYGITGGIISAVDLLKGMGRVLGLEVADVVGATGYYDTNYEGKAEAALEILERNDMVFVHVEAPDEAGHNGDVKEKIKAIENFDSRITARIIEALSHKEEPHRILILPDHPTPVKKRTHTAEPVPFAMAGKGIEPDDVTVFNERAARAGSVKIDEGWKLMRKLLET